MGGLILFNEIIVDTFGLNVLDIDIISILLLILLIAINSEVKKVDKRWRYAHFRNETGGDYYCQDRLDVQLARRTSAKENTHCCKNTH